MLTREELYALVWAEPMIKIGERLGVSGSYLARICSLLNVPRPERGYWAKLEVGKAPPVPPLPEPRPGDQVHWSREGEQPARTRTRPSAPRPRQPSVTPVRIARNSTHGLIRGAKAHFEKGYAIEEGAYLKPYKKLLVDVTSSEAGLEKALALANDLFNAFESVGHRVVLAPSDSSLRRSQIEEREAGGKARDPWAYRGPWSPLRPTVAFVGSVAIGLAIIEMSEHVTLHYLNGKYLREREFLAAPQRFRHHSWTSNQDVPSGRMRIVAYAPYGRVSWSRQWDETKTSSLRSSLKSIVEAVEAKAPELVAMLDAADRRAEIERREAEEQHQRWLRKEDRRRIDVSITESKTDLRDVIKRWSDALAIEQFLIGVEARSSQLAGSEKEEMLARLELARELLGTHDPLDFIRQWKAPFERYRPRYGPNGEELP